MRCRCEGVVVVGRTPQSSRIGRGVNGSRVLARNQGVVYYGRVCGKGWKLRTPAAETVA